MSLSAGKNHGREDERKSAIMASASLIKLVQHEGRTPSEGCITPQAVKRQVQIKSEGKRASGTASRSELPSDLSATEAARAMAAMISGTPTIGRSTLHEDTQFLSTLSQTRKPDAASTYTNAQASSWRSPLGKRKKRPAVYSLSTEEAYRLEREQKKQDVR